MSDTYKDHGHPPGWENEHDPRCQACAQSELASSDGSPVRVTLSRRKGWKMPANTIKVCRPGIWGNPFNVDVERTPDQAVLMYEKWLGSADWDSWLWSKHRKHWLRTQAGKCKLRTLLDELRGKNLACWCRQGAPCHADVLLRLANADSTTKVVY